MTTTEATDRQTDPTKPGIRATGLRAHRQPLLTNISAARWLLLAIVLASIYFFHGFLVPVLAATVIALASWPLRERSVHQAGLGRTMTATFMVLVLVCFIVIPITMALAYAFRELKDWINWAILVNAAGAPTPAWMVDLPQIGDWLDQNWQTYIGHPGGISEIVQAVSGSNIGTIYRGALTAGSLAFHLFLTLLFLLITLFVLYRDGDRIVAQMDRVGARILPDRWDRLSRVVPATISSTVTGMTLIAIGEGFILGIAYWIAGVPSPVTFGVITGFMALIPGGAPLSFTLVSVYLAASGSPLAGLGLFLWGSIELFIVDKTIRPLLVGGPVKLPFLPTFFGLVGGVKTMGIVGLFVGPVLMALLVSIWREWQREISEDELKRADMPVVRE
ncbi:AI-2E family transporter [Paracoccus laeviglucosivorans]|uniref:Predicted PurR-regulated permease PerM n=1 Tax=Paracoccus laeviglucosivorans TaxID=1197861 RepID=A0A521CB52_9RHOB|nr:AI-2E family transporter [Paracoccus laeviglucosivorans]SMO56659.1 Predicted PurR-regulated permease PerM [Paracoccus laeviglucosivorans]